MDLMNAESHSRTGQYFELMCSYSYLPLINKPTRVTADSATLIDNIFTNNINGLNNCMHGIFVTDISDHYPIFHMSLKKYEANKELYITKRKYSDANKQSFLDNLQEINWQNVLATTSTNSSFDLFHSLLKTVIHNITDS